MFNPKTAQAIYKMCELAYDQILKEKFQIKRSEKCQQVDQQE